MSLCVFFFLSSCSSAVQREADRLNSLSYGWHYRDIDSAGHYARQAYAASRSYADGCAEALNNLAFVAMARMDYRLADSLLRQVSGLTDNHLELLIANVQQMRLCQRRSQNLKFYEYRQEAITSLQRLSEDRNLLTPRQQSRLLYAESEMAIVTSTYYYYVGLRRQSVDALGQTDLDRLRHDTAQYVNYLYNVGAGGILTDGSPEQISREEVSCLERCLSLSERCGYRFFVAQAKESLAEHTSDSRQAIEALQLFSSYGDIYQIAGAHRTIATCYHLEGRETEALQHLRQSLADERIFQAPDLVASIREQFSIVYAALGDTLQSECNSRLFREVQEQTRRDRQLEARAARYERVAGQLNLMLAAVLVAILLVVALLWLFSFLSRRQKGGGRLDELLEQKLDEVLLKEQQLENAQRRHFEQRARVSLVSSQIPLIDRILYTIDHLPSVSDSAVAQDENGSEFKVQGPEFKVQGSKSMVQGSRFNEQLDYIRELTDKINEQNNLLTEWIKLSQGELDVHIESFALQPLFDIIQRGRSGFAMKGVCLTVEPTSAVVKADRVLTLFMLNTLTDNARKFTDSGGSVTVSAEELADCIELSVADTGCGISADRLPGIFSRQLTGGHGFGLLNCKGIIEKYRKMSRLFSVCQLSVQSRVGQGSRFFFRLPKGIVRSLLTAVMLLQVAAGGVPVCAASVSTVADSAAVAADVQRRDADGERLSAYCRMMQQSESNKRTAVTLLVLLLLSIPVSYYFLYYRKRLDASRRHERQLLGKIESAADRLSQLDHELNQLHVANAVLDNCLSALKHETMYYPSRIRQLADTRQLDMLAETTRYYRDLYGLLSLQAMRVLSQVTLPVGRTTFHGVPVLAVDAMLRFLTAIVKPVSVTSELRDSRYVVFRMQSSAHMSEADFLCCRQMLRDIGEQTHRRGCGINADGNSVQIVLPRG